MSINSVQSSTNANSGIDQLVRQIMSNADTNHDGQLSSTEFGMFLTKIIERMSPVSLLSSRPVVTPMATKIDYQPMPGFDTGKLNDLSHKTPKYMFARALQDMGLNAKSARGNLQPLVETLTQRGFPDAKAVGDDKIDFGAKTAGVVDVITSSETWWWGPTAA